MKRVFWLLAPALLLLSACATANFQTDTKLGGAPSIVGSQVYIYSFIDLRETDFGDAMVNAVNRQLVERLAERSVVAQVVSYAETTAGKFTARGGGSVMIPVAEIIASRLEEEAAMGADYRLIIVPSQITIYGATQQYDVRWELVNVTSGRVVWMTALRGNRTVWYSHNEDAEGRAATFVNGVIAEMDNSGLFAPAHQPATSP